MASKADDSAPKCSQDEKKGEDLNAVAVDSQDSCTVDTADGKTKPPLLDEDGKPISKNQLKKRRRREQMLEKKRVRKAKEKEDRIAKAQAEGRDLDEERRQMAQNTASGKGRERRAQLFRSRLAEAESSFRVCLDCSFEDCMTQKEVSSLASQIRYCYASNRKSDKPIYFSVSSLGGQTRELLDRVSGFPEQWTPRAFSFSPDSLEVFHARDKLVYLTSDSEHTLQQLDNTKVYVIGGIVDRNRLKRAAIDRAEALGIPTAKLPIDEHLKLVTTKVLTCNHVFDILKRVHENGNDWKQAMLSVLPERKDAQTVSDE